ncbi:hypothetical protein NGF19_15865 [Streptomyces sp. RY43-2]|uniref:NifU family protein n=1 Tax=Streptomyces macrolidinus TaxID=2952607 RepID=A0ABT0ZF98_9ACTN|nr:hypothetical protein [Streptomyces macrolidinus]MCN9242250.1 hypothetical protein [Streptomyces macrolidinus]
MSAASSGRSPVDAVRTGRRVEEVLDRLAASGDPAVTAAAEDLVRALMEFYGAGLARILDLLPQDAPVTGLLGDDLVASLLVLHDLHPEDRETRVARALATVRGHDLEVVDFDETTGTLRLRTARGAGCGCGGEAAVRQAAEEALACFAPEVTVVEVEAGEREPVLLQIGTRAAPTRTP